MIKSEQKTKDRKEPYEAPACRILTVAVERGFAGSPVEGGGFDTDNPDPGDSEWDV